MSQIAQIESLDNEGRGVAHVDGKTIFISNALPYEQVTYRSYKVKNSFEMADAVDILRESSARTEPYCPNFSVCGGCSMQHVEFSSQVAVKQRVLEDTLAHIGKVKPQMILPPIAGVPWGYRHRARISVRYVTKKDSVLVGFHEKHAIFVVDMHTCKVLPTFISNLIDPLREMIHKLSIRKKLPQIELAVGENVAILVLRIMAAPSAEDEVILKQFIDEYSKPNERLQFWLQPGKLNTVQPFYPLDAPALTYNIDNFGIEMPYNPTEFTQVNPQINQVMVTRAIKLLDPQPNERIADMFCGIGNFTLPIARSGADVIGIEGLKILVKRAKENAIHNGLANNTDFQVSNLFLVTEESLASLGYFDKMLIDPPRDGAMALVQAFNDKTAPKRIVYVSCNPATLARDADILVHEKGYKLTHAGVINMFPHTAHVESIAVFERG